jgi:16S rRNA (cytosine967-C5)-methyltransferase
MSHLYLLRHIDFAVEIIQSYDFKSPFHLYLKTYFKRFNKFGSRDRKSIKRCCYAYFRMGNMFADLSVKEKILIFLLYNHADDVEVQPLLINNSFNEIVEKVRVDLHSEWSRLFPLPQLLAPNFHQVSFAQSHMKEKNVFFRKMCEEHNVSLLQYQQISDNCYKAEPTSPLDSLLEQGLIQIQDVASQEVCSKIEPGMNTWDVCAASGGKLIHLFHKHPGVRFFASDIRPNILRNLHKRCHIYGLHPFASSVLDMSVPHNEMYFQVSKGGKITIEEGFFDTIIIDAPCSGSGVWGRNPEGLCSFTLQELSYYQQLQQSIVGNALPFLKKGGMLYYITCSVYQNENLDHLNFWNSLGLSVLNESYVDYSAMGGDVLFMASLVRI